MSFDQDPTAWAVEFFTLVDDLPQIVTGLAVTREGIPVRVWCWPAAPPTPR